MRVRHLIVIGLVVLTCATQFVTASSHYQQNQLINSNSDKGIIQYQEPLEGAPDDSTEPRLSPMTEMHYYPQIVRADLSLALPMHKSASVVGAILNNAGSVSLLPEATFLEAGRVQPFRSYSKPENEAPISSDFAPLRPVEQEEVAVSTCTVTSTNDSGSGSLRECLANVSSGDTINFDTSIFPIDSPKTIFVTSQLPFVTVDSITIDASNAGVILNGFFMLEDGSGVVIHDADSTKVLGLQIESFPLNGIEVIDGATNTMIGGDRLMGEGNVLINNGYAGIVLVRSDTINNIILGNYIGVNSLGNQAVGNQHGIVIDMGSSNNTIGGSTATERNIISGNSDFGVYIRGSGTSGNQVSGNYIGTNVTGMFALPQKLGVLLTVESQESVIGGSQIGMGNLISGNSEGGVWLEVGTFNNQVSGNYIGVDATGNGRLDNKAGVVVNFGAHNNTIGGETAIERNVISGNTLVGVAVEDTENDGTQNNRIIGNHIGTNATGTAALSNYRGLAIGFGAQMNVVGGSTQEERNIISGNEYTGIQLQNSGTNHNTISGNFIGTDVNGTASIANGEGIILSAGAQHNLIGGDSSGTRNIISGNNGSGIISQESNTSNNDIQGNYIGVTVHGNSALANNFGVYFICGASNNVVGGSMANAGNVISGNLRAGVIIFGRFDETLECIFAPNTSGIRIEGNFIGTDHLGQNAISNKEDGIVLLDGAQNNIIGGDTPNSGNVISGNEMYGILLQDNNTDHNKILGNLIGTDSTGKASIPNETGVAIILGASSNIIGGSTTLSRNIISGNRLVGIGIGGPATANQVMGNFIGTDITGTGSVGNVNGIVLSHEAKDNQIGGLTSSARNVISGNAETGIFIQNAGTENNFIWGNYIGTAENGLLKLPNALGVGIVNGAQKNFIGGEENGARNLISGNSIGIEISGSETYSNTVQGNYVGTDVTGTDALGNVNGITIGDGARYNIIGGNTSETRNVISGNSNFGLQLERSGTTDNQVFGNYIGVDKTGQLAVPNDVGVSIILGASNNLIGGNTAEDTNLISGNARIGIQIGGKGATYNDISGNFIGTNAEGTKPLPNLINGILIAEGASQNTIGGATVQARNLISGNLGAGIQIQGADTISNTIIGNYIGVTVDGQNRLGNGWGIVVGFGSRKNKIGGLNSNEGNVVAASKYGGVQFQNANTSENVVIGNLIGTREDGKAALGNDAGVVLMSGAHHNTIGGFLENARNLISGNQSTGIAVTGNETTNNLIVGNSIGSDITGTTPVGNGNGVRINNGASSNQIGTKEEGNLISGNGDEAIVDEGHGIWIEGEGTQDNVIEGNIIGVSVSLVSPLPNMGHGVFLDEDTQTNIIGSDNVVRFNESAGIAIANGSAQNNTITRNQIYDNQGAEIFLIRPVTQPLVARSKNHLSISGTVCSNCKVEIFGSNSSEPSGEQFLMEVTANTAGEFSQTEALFASWPYLSITTTDASGTTLGFYVPSSTSSSTSSIYLPLMVNIPQQ